MSGPVDQTDDQVELLVNGSKESGREVLESGRGESRDKGTGREMEKSPISWEAALQNEVGTKSGDRIELGPADRAPGSVASRALPRWLRGGFHREGRRQSVPRTSSMAIASTRKLSITRLATVGHLSRP
jgi:hypothetical protein